MGKFKPFKRNPTGFHEHLSRNLESPREVSEPPVEGAGWRKRLLPIEAGPGGRARAPAPCAFVTAVWLGKIRLLCRREMVSVLIHRLRGCGLKERRIEF